jgi:hypothetical protein
LRRGLWRMSTSMTKLSKCRVFTQIFITFFETRYILLVGKPRLGTIFLWSVGKCWHILSMNFIPHI